jgi:hypothetical protein
MAPRRHVRRRIRGGGRRIALDGLIAGIAVIGKPEEPSRGRRNLYRAAAGRSGANAERPK